MYRSIPNTPPVNYFSYFFFKGANTLSRKKLSENNHIVELDHIVEPYEKMDYQQSRDCVQKISIIIDTIEAPLQTIIRSFSQYSGVETWGVGDQACPPQ